VAGTLNAVPVAEAACGTPPRAAALLGWYDRHRRALPWRADPPDPYRVWLSEIMLQQTTVAAVRPRYERFLARFPTVEALAAAPEAAVMEEWAGLGYYARARNLHACARAVITAGGRFPEEEGALRALPGVGAYTAAAIAAIAFGRPVLPVDGNVERVVARMFAVADPLPAARPRLRALARSLAQAPPARARPGDFAQALFDLGATICTPRNPTCTLCPWRADCAGHAQGVAGLLPAKAPRREKPRRYGVHFLVIDAAGSVLVRRRPPRGLLGGMLELPGTPWRDTAWPAAEAMRHAPLSDLDWQAMPGEARHAFTHFELVLTVRVGHVPHFAAPSGFEVREGATLGAALPTAMRRVLLLASASTVDGAGGNAAPRRA
jgi:A/G-specific adenine glycosylase